MDQLLGDLGAPSSQGMGILSGTVGVVVGVTLEVKRDGATGNIAELALVAVVAVVAMIALLALVAVGAVVSPRALGVDMGEVECNGQGGQEEKDKEEEAQRSSGARHLAQGVLVS